MLIFYSENVYKSFDSRVLIKVTISKIKVVSWPAFLYHKQMYCNFYSNSQAAKLPVKFCNFTAIFYSVPIKPVSHA